MTYYAQVVAPNEVSSGPGEEYAGDSFGVLTFLKMLPGYYLERVPETHCGTTNGIAPRKCIGIHTIALVFKS